MIGLCVVRT